MVSHVDDFLLIGDKTFENDIKKKLEIIFKFSRIEENAFKIRVSVSTFQ